jgi:hypothetical protein
LAILNFFYHWCFALLKLSIPAQLSAPQIIPKMAIVRISISLCRFVRSMRGSSISAKCSTSLYLGRSCIVICLLWTFAYFPSLFPLQLDFFCPYFLDAIAFSNQDPKQLSQYQHSVYDKKTAQSLPPTERPCLMLSPIA